MIVISSLRQWLVVSLSLQLTAWFSQKSVDLSQKYCAKKEEREQWKPFV